VRNLCRNRLRDLQKRVALPLPLDDNEPESSKHKLSSPKHPLGEVEEKETHEILKEEINQLPQHLKEVVKLRLEGKTFEEIAQTLGISTSEAHKRWNEAVKRLKRRMLEKL
jgi:RNA polymerase sigma factor (sigma-70 family)